MAPLTPVRPESTTEAAVKKLKQDIMSGALAPARKKAKRRR